MNFTKEITLKEGLNDSLFFHNESQGFLQSHGTMENSILSLETKSNRNDSVKSEDNYQW